MGLIAGLTFDKNRGVPAVVVKIFGRRQNQLFGFKLEAGIVFQKVPDKLAVLAPLNAARAVADSFLEVSRSDVF